jgi:hypothetical protein
MALGVAFKYDETMGGVYFFHMGRMRPIPVLYEFVDFIGTELQFFARLNVIHIVLEGGLTFGGLGHACESFGGFHSVIAVC